MDLGAAALRSRFDNDMKLMTGFAGGHEFFVAHICIIIYLEIFLIFYWDVNQ